MNDISGKTLYFKLKVKGLKSDILVSNYKMKNNDAFLKLQDFYKNQETPSYKVKGNILSQLLLLANLA